MTTAERPTLFSWTMVHALLDGRKTQTRRVANPRGRNSLLDREADGSDVWTDGYVLDPGNAEWLARSAPAHVGETMYVREAFRFAAGFDDMRPGAINPAEAPTVFYEADDKIAALALGNIGYRPPSSGGKLRPGIHMPRWASRIERQIVSVRLERLNLCTEEDALAEGVIWSEEWQGFIVPGVAHPNPDFPVLSRPTAREMYAALWDVINGSGAWLSDPRVWVIEFSPS